VLTRADPDVPENRFRRAFLECRRAMMAPVTDVGMVRFGLLAFAVTWWVAAPPPSPLSPCWASGSCGQRATAWSWHNRSVDFARELDGIAAFLGGAGVRFAVIGGVALAAYGHPRMTLDLDVVTEARVQDGLVAFMESQGFVTLHRSTGYSNHRHADRRRGRVDFMYVRGETSERLFEGVRELPGPGGRTIPLPRPEHLIAMKVRAMKDAPERAWQELVDVGFLLRLDGVDRDEARGYFERAGLEEKWRDLAAVL
jgi:hypothetical protein